jgi:hypothetical protein
MLAVVVVGCEMGLQAQGVHLLAVTEALALSHLLTLHRLIEARAVAVGPELALPVTVHPVL